MYKLFSNFFSSIKPNHTIGNSSENYRCNEQSIGKIVHVITLNCWHTQTNEISVGHKCENTDCCLIYCFSFRLFLPFLEKYFQIPRYLIWWRVLSIYLDSIGLNIFHSAYKINRNQFKRKLLLATIFLNHWESIECIAWI